MDNRRVAGRVRVALLGCVIPAILIGCSAGPGSSAPASVGTPPGSVAPATSAPPPPTAEPSLPSAAYRKTTIPGGGPNVIAFTGDRVWVELHRSNSIAALDPTSLAATTYDIPVHCQIAADGASTVWATYHQDNRLTRIDGVTGKATLLVTIPEACGIGAGGGQVWVTSPSERRVYRLDPKTGKALFDVKVSGDPFGIFPRGEVVYASGESGTGWLWALDPADGHTLATGGPGVVSTDAVVLAFGSLWATGRTSPVVLRLDPKTLAIQATIPIGSEPSGVAASDEGLWVSQLDGHLTFVDPKTNAAAARWALPYTFLAWPTFAFDRVWLTSLEEDAVISVDPAAALQP